MLSANVGFLAIPGVVISNLGNTITNPNQVIVFTTPVQVASYMSMTASIASILIGLVLTHRNRLVHREDSAGVVSESWYLGS